MTQSIAAPKPKIFYGWWIVVASVVGTSLGGLVFTYGVGTFFLPLINEFGWSRAELSGAISLARLEGGLSGPIEGMLIERFGPRRIMLTGIVLVGLGYVLLSRANSLLMFYVFFVLFLALGHSFATGTSLYSSVAYWFVRRRGLAMGLMNTGWGLGGTAVPLLAVLIAAIGWRGAFLVAAGLVLTVGVPLSFVLRNRPEKYGLLPDGDVACDGPRPPKRQLPRFLRFVQPVKRPDLDFTALEALRTRAFWTMSLVWGGRMFVTGAIALHLIPLFSDMGLSPERAASVLGLVTAVSIAGRLGFGWLGDVFEKRYVLAFCYGVMAMGLIVLLNVHSFWESLLFVFLYAPAYGGTAVPTHSLRGELFGRKYFASIHGVFLMSEMWATILGPIFAGYTFDVTGSYRLALLTFIIISAVTAVLILSVGQPKAPARFEAA